MPNLSFDSLPTDLATVNPWQFKPWWCQPWSIVLTGVAVVGGSWVVMHRWWLTLLVAVPIGLWMGFFLLLWPRLMRDWLQAERASLAQEPSADDEP